MDKHIPINNIHEFTNKGLIVHDMISDTKFREKNAIIMGAHRDNYYGFWFMEKGMVEVMVDFKIFQSKGAAIFSVMPGEVHQALSMKNISGWFVAANADLLSESVRSFFEESLSPFMPIAIEKPQAIWLNQCAMLLRNTFQNEISARSNEKWSSVQPLLHAYTSQFAAIFAQKTRMESVKESRPMQLTRLFRIQVRKQYKTLKSPFEYAALLNISVGYLTEIVKEVTGQSVSYWIQQEILTEAKRLLFYTDKTVKEIAYELGYDDHAYFSRIFSSHAGESALAFRQNSRK